MELHNRYPGHRTRCSGRHPYHGDVDPRRVERATLPCDCGQEEPHEHCLDCGQLVSTGSGETIATFRVRL